MQECSIEVRTAVVVVAKVCVVVGSDSENALEFKKTTATAGAGIGIAQTLFTVSQVYV